MAIESLEDRIPLAVDHVVHISVDGLASRWLEPLLRAEERNSTGDYSTFLELQNEGSWTLNARTDANYTFTLPNHTSMLTGRPVWENNGVPLQIGHAWTDNADPPVGQTLHTNHPDLDYVRSVFDVVHDQGGSTALYATKSKFSLFDRSYNSLSGAADTNPQGGNNGRDKIDRYFASSDIWRVVDQFTASLGTEEFTYSFLHLAGPDRKGHQFGWGSQAWSESVKESDRQIAQVMNVIRSDSGLRDSTAIIVTSDHGGLSTGHASAAELANYQIPFYIWGTDIQAGADLYSIYSSTTSNPGFGQPDFSNAQQPIRNGDSGNLALELLGLPPIPGSTIRNLHHCAVNTICDLTPDNSPTESFDFGDAPAPFPTLQEEAGAFHKLEPGFFLGSMVDAESNGQPDRQAMADDLADDDEDGITFISAMVPGQTASLDAVASEAGILQAWFDWNADGDWADSGEQVVANEPLIAGNNRLTIEVPSTVTSNSLFARFRFSRQLDLPPSGSAETGEVEDYQVIIQIDPMTIGEVKAEDDSFQVRSGTASVSLPVLKNDQGTGDLTIINLIQSDLAQATIASDGRSLIYAPAASFQGSETLVYQVQDARGSVGQANVLIQVNRTISPHPHPPSKNEGPEVALRLKATNEAGDAVTQVAPGEQFWLSLFVEDIRPDAQGVAHAFVDVVFDGKLIAKGPVLAGPFYSVDSAGMLEIGQINEAGGRQSSDPGAQEALLFKVPLAIDDFGLIRFKIVTADSPDHDVRLIGAATATPFRRWKVSPLELQVIQGQETAFDPLDVDQNQIITPLDALLVINDLNQHGARILADSPQAPAHPVDVNGDGAVAAIDVLLIVNWLNRQAQTREIVRPTIAAAIAADRLFDSWSRDKETQRVLIPSSASEQTFAAPFKPDNLNRWQIP